MVVLYFFRGVCDDIVQCWVLEVYLSWWLDSYLDFVFGDNLVFLFYGGFMVDLDGIYLWIWDVWLFFVFLVFSDVWVDGVNWQCGYWLIGCFGGVSVKGLICVVLEDYGLLQFDFCVYGFGGGFDGYVLSGLVSVCDVIELVLFVFGGFVFDCGMYVDFCVLFYLLVVDFGLVDLVEQEVEDLLVI